MLKITIRNERNQLSVISLPNRNATLAIADAALRDSAGQRRLSAVEDPD